MFKLFKKTSNKFKTQMFWDTTPCLLAKHLNLISKVSLMSYGVLWGLEYIYGWSKEMLCAKNFPKHLKW